MLRSSCSSSSLSLCFSRGTAGSWYTILTMAWGWEIRKLELELWLIFDVASQSNKNETQHSHGRLTEPRNSGTILLRTDTEKFIFQKITARDCVRISKLLASGENEVLLYETKTQSFGNGRFGTNQSRTEQLFGQVSLNFRILKQKKGEITIKWGFKSPFVTVKVLTCGELSSTASKSTIFPVSPSTCKPWANGT